MSAPELQWLAQVFTERMLNSAAEGMLLAGLAWGLLRLIGRQSSRTRFAVWFATLATLVALPFFTGASAAHLPMIASAKVHREIVLSAAWAQYLFAAWAAGAALLLLRLSVGLWQVHRLRSRCRELEPELMQPAVAEVFRDFSTRFPTKLCVSERVNVPAAIGFFRPAIVFPAWLLPQLSAAEIAVVLMHEHAHLCRRDQWTNLAQKFARALFFFHPAVWWIENHLTLEREMACDDIVLAQSQSPKAYASFLVSFAEKLQNAPALELAQALVSRMHQMSIRVTQILDGTRSRRTGMLAPVLGVNAALLALVVAATPYVPQLVAFRSLPGQNQPARMEAVSRKAQPTSLSATAAFNSPLAHAVSQRLDPEPQPRVIPAAYHPRTDVLPLRQKVASHSVLNSPPQANRRLEWATNTSAKPAVIRAKADANSPSSPETFVVVETTQYDSSGSGIWTLCIWQVKGGKKQLETAIAQII